MDSLNSKKKYILVHHNRVLELQPYCSDSGCYRRKVPDNPEKYFLIFESMRFLQQVLKSDYYPSPFLPLLFHAANVSPRFWRYEVLHDPSLEDYFVSFEVNARGLEQMALLGKDLTVVFPDHKLEKSDTTVKDLQEDKDALARSFVRTRCVIPAKSTTPQRQPLGFRKSIQLYKYQLDCVSWMKSVEDDVNVGYWYTDVNKWHAANRISIVFDMLNKKVVTPGGCKEYTNKAKPKGGILADEMGLGKTMELIALILANPGDPSKLEPDINMTDDAQNFLTNATLVVVPNHLIRQWHEEIEKCIGSNMNVVVMKSMLDMNCTVYGDIINADVVLVTFQLLANANYLLIGKNLRADKDRQSTREEWVRSYLKNSSGMQATYFRTLQLAPHHCGRSPRDNGRQILHRLEMFASLATEFVWYVSGTPFPNLSTSNGLVDFLRFPATAYSSTFVYGDLIMKNLFWRNTKASVKDEYQIPQVVEDLVLINQTDIEKAVYQIAGNKDELQRSMCCHPTLTAKYNEMLKRCTCLSDIRRALINHKKLTSDVAEAKKAVDGFIRTPIHPGGDQHWHKTLNRLNEAFDKLTTKLKRAKSTLAGLDAARGKTYYGPDVSAEARLPLLTDDIDVSSSQEKPAEETKAASRLQDEKVKGKAGDEEAKLQGNGEKAADRGDNESNEKKAEDNGEKESKGEENEEGVLKGSEIASMTAAQMKNELVARGVALPKKPVRAALLKLLKEVKPITPVAKVETSVTTQKTKGKRKQPESDSTKAPEGKKIKAVDATPKKTLHDKIKQQNILNFLIEEHGAKIAHVITYLRRLWGDNPQAKILMFSQFNAFLYRMSDLLTSYGIENAFMEGNTVKKTRVISAFKSAEAPIRVLLLSLTTAASGTNLIEATHIIFLEPAPGTKLEAITTESQAIGRAHRQGQTGQVTIVRFVTRETIEYTSYIKNNNNNAPEQQSDEKEEQGETIMTLERGESLSGRPGLQRTGSSFISIIQ